MNKHTGNVAMSQFFSFNSKVFEYFLLKKQALEDIAEKQSRHEITCDLVIKQHKSRYVLLSIETRVRLASNKRSPCMGSWGRGVTTIETATDITSLADK